jgi:hypothetical protein
MRAKRQGELQRNTQVAAAQIKADAKQKARDLRK